MAVDDRAAGGISSPRSAGIIVPDELRAEMATADEAVLSKE